MTQHTGPHVSRRSQSLTPWYEHLDRFEQAWKSGKPPRIDEFLRSALGASPATDERTRRLLQEELVKIDLECRWRRARETAEQHRSEASGGERPPHPILEDYVRHYPEVGPLERLPIGLILEEYRVRSRFGRRPESDEYFARFPHLKSVLP